MESTLVHLIQEKTGISEQQAQMALETVIGFLKDKLPEPLAGQLDAVLGGGSGSSDQLGSMLGALGGVFGKQQWHRLDHERREQARTARPRNRERARTSSGRVSDGPVSWWFAAFRVFAVQTVRSRRPSPPYAPIITDAVMFQRSRSSQLFGCTTTV